MAGLGYVCKTDLTIYPSGETINFVQLGYTCDVTMGRIYPQHEHINQSPLSKNVYSENRLTISRTGYSPISALTFKNNIGKNKINGKIK
jgi:hypothetical protein